MISLMYLTIVLPLLGFIINGAFGSRIKNVEQSKIPFFGEKVIGTIGSGVIGLSFLITLAAFFQTLSLPVEQRQSIINLFTWLKVSGLDISFAYPFLALGYVFVGIMAWWLLGESITATRLTGMLIIVFGLIVLSRGG